MQILIVEFAGAQYGRGSINGAVSACARARSQPRSPRVSRTTPGVQSMRARSTRAGPLGCRHSCSLYRTRAACDIPSQHSAAARRTQGSTSTALKSVSTDAPLSCLEARQKALGRSNRNELKHTRTQRSSIVMICHPYFTTISAFLAQPGGCAQTRSHPTTPSTLAHRSPRKAMSASLVQASPAKVGEPFNALSFGTRAATHGGLSVRVANPGQRYPSARIKVDHRGATKSEVEDFLAISKVAGGPCSPRYGPTYGID